VTAIITDPGVLEFLDFTPELPCEHQNHGKAAWHVGPAAVLVEGVAGTCPACHKRLVGSDPRFTLCRSAWDRAGAQGLQHRACGSSVPRDLAWRLVAEL
jgi:hypothetical protein